VHLHSTTSSFAGTYVKKACLSASEKGVCEPCEFDTYTEHGNGLLMCLSCTKCRIGNSGVWKKKKKKNTVYILYHTAKSFLFTLRSCKPNQFCVHTIKFLQIYYLTVNCLLFVHLLFFCRSGNHREMHKYPEHKVSVQTGVLLLTWPGMWGVQEMQQVCS